MTPRIWKIICWATLAALALAAILWHEPSLMIGVAVAAVLGLTTGFAGPRARRNRPPA
jgi:hypothetical protein